MLGASHLYSVLVEGSANASAPHAIRFAKRLAKEGMGALLNPQTEEIWPPTSRRRVARPDRGSKIDVVGARWYHLLDEIPHDFPDRFLRIARRHLPEALPLRFGPTNQGNLARDGDQSFADMFTKEDSVHASGAFPVFGSFFPCLLAGNPGMWHRKGDAQGLQVSIDANSLTDPSGGSLFSGSSSTSP